MNARLMIAVGLVLLLLDRAPAQGQFEEDFRAGVGGEMVQRRASNDAWVLDNLADYSRAADPGERQRFELARRRAEENHLPGQVQTPVDTDQDGLADTWVFFENDSPAWLEIDRFGTGVRDLRMDLRTEPWAATQYQGWSVEPPVALPRTAVEPEGSDLFDRHGLLRNGGGSTPRDVALAQASATLMGSLAGLATASQAELDEVEAAAAHAIRLRPAFLAIHRRENLAEKLKIYGGVQVNYRPYDLDRKPGKETVVGYTPSGIYAVQVYRRDWNETGKKNIEGRDPGFLTEVVFHGDRAARVDVGERTWFALDKSWVRVAPDARETIAKKYLLPGYHGFQSGRWYEALEHWRIAATLAAILGDYHLTQQGEPNGQMNPASRRKWTFDVSGLPAYELIEVARQMGYRESVPNFTTLARAAAERRNWTEAINLCDLSVRLADKNGEALSKVDALEVMSQVYRRLGIYDRAIECLTDSLDVETTLNYAADINKNLKYLAQDPSDPDKLRLAMAIRSHAMAVNRAAKLAAIAALHCDLGELERATSFLTEAERMARSLNHRHLQADLLNLRGKIDLAQGDFVLGVERMQRAYELAGAQIEWQREDERGAKLLALGKAAHEFTIVQPRTSHRVQMKSKTDPRSYQGYCASLLADAFLERGSDESLAQHEIERFLQEGAFWLQRARDDFRHAHDEEGLLADGLLRALIASRLGRVDEAQQLAEQTAQAADERDMFETHWRSLSLLGEIHTARTQHAKAAETYERALDLIESQRTALYSEPARQSFLSSKIEVYEKLALLRFALSPSDAEPIWQCMERAKARTLLDMVGGQRMSLKGADVVELERRRPELFLSLPGVAGRRAVLSGLGVNERLSTELVDLPHLQEAASLATVQPVSLDQVQEILTPDDLLIEYFATESHLLAVTVTHQDVRAFRLDDWGRRRLRDEVNALRDLLQRPDGVFESQASRLYENILAPCLVGRPRRLIVAPSGPLTYLPLAALMDGRGRFVIENHQVCYTPSASALVWSRRRRAAQEDESTLDSREHNMLVVGNPRPHAGYAALPHAEAEARAIANLNASATLLTGTGATESQIREALPKVRFFHFAGHTRLDANAPMRTALLCTDQVEEDGAFEVREIFGLQMRNCELVVLSACETRLGRWSRGDEVVGLERAFLRAGVPTVVASLWKVDDASTQTLMKTFYDQMSRAGRGKLEALRGAQLAMLQGKFNDRIALARRGLGQPAALTSGGGVEPRSTSPRHPFYWAGFVLSGDWE